MITIDPTLLANLGINLPAGQEADFINHIMETLDERVGLAIVDLLTDEEAAELLDLEEAGNEAATTAWIQAHVPEYQAVIQDEYDILMGEVAEHASSV